MQRAKFALANLVGDVGMGFERFIIKQGRHDVAQRVSLEGAANHATVPMHVLQHAVDVAGRLNAQIGLVTAVPHLR